MTALRRQWAILLDLAAGPLSVAELATRHGVSKATAQRDVDLLAEIFSVVCLDTDHRQRKLYAVLPLSRDFVEATAQGAA